jgi:polyphosphate kinase 2
MKLASINGGLATENISEGHHSTSPLPESHPTNPKNSLPDKHKQSKKKSKKRAKATSTESAMSTGIDFSTDNEASNQANNQANNRANEQTDSLTEPFTQPGQQSAPQLDSAEMRVAVEPESSSNLATPQPQTEPADLLKDPALKNKAYRQALDRLQAELVEMQAWVKRHGLRVVILFEGRDAAGKGGAIKRIADCLNPRGCRVVALGKPSDVEKTQWYFQRYVMHLPSAGEIVLFDRSWYNRAGVERVMEFCTEEEYQEFLQSCPEFERMLVRSGIMGIILLKYWFSVSPEVQEQRLQARLKDPTKRWKLSDMDLESRNLWEDYSKAKDAMLVHTHIPEAPWFNLDSDDKRRARLNLMEHILSQVPHDRTDTIPLELPPRRIKKHYVRPPMNEQSFVPEVY